MDYVPFGGKKLYKTNIEMFHVKHYEINNLTLNSCAIVLCAILCERKVQKTNVSRETIRYSND